MKKLILIFFSLFTVEVIGQEEVSASKAMSSAELRKAMREGELKRKVLKKTNNKEAEIKKAVKEIGGKHIEEATEKEIQQVEKLTIQATNEAKKYKPEVRHIFYIDLAQRYCKEITTMPSKEYEKCFERILPWFKGAIEAKIKTSN